MMDPHLDTHRLRQFMAVAEHLNITRAAADLQLTQQAVSSTLKSLERELGVSLIRRTGRSIDLTPAGQTLRDGGGPLIDASRALVRATRAAAAAEPDHLIVGHTPALTSDEVFDLTEPVRQAFPDASITARQCFPGDLAPALRAGTISVGLRRGSTTPRDLAAAIIAYSMLNIAVSAEHPLAWKASITMGELAGFGLILWGPPGESFYSDFLMSVCRRAGFEPSVTVNHIQGTTPTTAVIGNGHFAFVTAEPGPCHHGRAVVIPIEDPPMAPVQALWLRHTTPRLVQPLLGAVVPPG
ncbi:LysR family transcriptional regulator [Rhodococcus yananensis]|uniref:LysR family transcriptional regulator n=1 Tax=Rhodococcus yananensis TaxID=2879464 RepID=UPI001CF807AB|nr:LysR family transcriptional regulator [Rhodococcus yananensis]